MDSAVASLGRVASLVLPNRGCMFTFHRTAPRERWAALPNRDFYLDLDFLDRLLRHLASTGWQVVTVEDMLRRAGRGRLVNFSIDDGYRDTWEHAAPLFRRHGVPMTLYITTGIPDGTLPLHNAGLEAILLREDRVALEGEVLDTATPAAKRDAYARISRDWDGPQAPARYAAFCAANGADPAALDRAHGITWDMLDELGRDPLVEIGAHTVLHHRLSALTPAAAMREVAGSGERLRARLGVAARHFAFPYGQSGDCGPREFAMAREAGFASAATTVKGWVRPGQDPFSLPRVVLNGSQRSLAVAEAHLAGLSALAARALGRV